MSPSARRVPPGPDGAGGTPPPPRFVAAPPILDGDDGPDEGAGSLGTVVLCLCMGFWILSFTPDPRAIGTLPAFVAALAMIERCRSLKHAFGYVVVFGAIAIGYGYRWLAPTVVAFGDVSVPASWVVLAAYGVWSTAHGLVFAWAYRTMLGRDRRPHPLAVVTVFVACEALPIRFLPWMAGHGAVDVAPLRQAAEWGGVPAVSFALLCLVVPFHEWLRWAFARGGAPARPRAALVTFAVGAAIYGIGWWRYDAVAAEERDPAAPRVRVGLVQANVGTTHKRMAERNDPKEALGNREAYRRGTLEAVEKGAELIVWPETALVEGLHLWDRARGAYRSPRVIGNELDTRGYGWLEEVGRDRTLLLGGYADEVSGRDVLGREKVVRYNCAMLREPGGSAWSLYRKVHLIPFGETMPFSNWFPSLNEMLPQSFEMAAGEPDQPPLVWKARGGLRIVSFICYEDLLADLVLDLSGGERPGLLVNLTNDSWFGDTWEPHQHLSFARFRAVEHRVPMVRATNTGVSVFVDATGDVTARAEVGEETALVRDVALVARGRTLFARFGFALRWVLWGAALALLVASWRRPRVVYVGA